MPHGSWIKVDLFLRFNVELVASSAEPFGVPAPHIGTKQVHGTTSLFSVLFSLSLSLAWEDTLEINRFLALSTQYGMPPETISHCHVSES